MSNTSPASAKAPAEDVEAPEKHPADKGESAEAPAEGTDDVDPPSSGSPRG